MRDVEPCRTPPLPPPQKGIDVLTYSNRGRVNGEAVEPHKTPNGGLVALLVPLRPLQRAANAGSKLVLGPATAEVDYRSGRSRALFGQYWYARGSAPRGMARPTCERPPSGTPHPQPRRAPSS
jgi:hypothetical protein